VKTEPAATAMAGLPRYVLITPARNEARLIEQTIHAVVAQTVRPVKWVIVSDGSTDATDEIVARHAQQHDWLQLVRTPEGTPRDFAGKVRAFNAGRAALLGVSFDVIGSLDADITFDAAYFEFILSRFAQDPQLGVAGTPFREGTHQYDYCYTNIEHVSGACQLFKRQCFEDIGGYQPLKGGGIDWVAVTTARMRGWHTRTFVDMVCHHHRPMGTAQSTQLAARFRLGKKDYVLGGHPLWELLRSAYQMKESPRVIGGLCLFSGYTWAWMSGATKTVSAELMTFHRHEQMARLRQLFHRPRRVAGTP
jgi:poly-beta-1,6-N-acetyl-D-glucosamine synthase